MPLPGYKSVTIKDDSDFKLDRISKELHKSKSDITEELIDEKYKEVI